jgi:hypothetical protein
VVKFQSMLGQIRIFAPRKGLKSDLAVESGTDPNLDSNILVPFRASIWLFFMFFFVFSFVEDFDSEPQCEKFSIGVIHKRF